METILIEIENSKHEFLINLLSEFSFIKNIQTIDGEFNANLLSDIIESENDILKENIILHEDLKEEIKSWKK